MTQPFLERTAAARERVRALSLAATPRWYNPWLHLGATTGIAVLCLVLGALMLHGVKPLEWLVVPAVFVFANGFEWRAHKDVLHRRLPFPLSDVYDRHTPRHHAVFMTNDMTIRSTREFRMVLMPAVGVAAIVVAISPFALLVSWLFGANAGWLVLVSGGVYMVTYELTHLAYHLPPGSFIGRLSLVRVLRHHHARHHDPRLMNKWNFNVTFPLFDLVHGTIAPKELGERAEADAAVMEDRSSVT
ncbi:MAG: Sterol desaturase [Myxococcaceae bacterium]|nr:Sterol desaturase [Myxococcaceae bacterium]